MDLFEAMYPQKGIVEHLQQFDISLDGKVILPWVGDNNAISDDNGNILGFIGPSAENGFEVFDKHMNKIGWSAENEHDGFDLYDSDNAQISFLHGNVFGGMDAYSMDQQLDITTHENTFDGVDIYSEDMELLGSSKNYFSSMDIAENPHLNSFDLSLQDAFVSQESSDIFSILDFIDGV